jgi:glycerol-3-phosphate acyltransferase PlsX
MGTIYMREVMGVPSPRTGLVNNGEERTKGTKTVLEAYNLLEKAEGINFVGNIEGKDIPNGQCDILVCDGFTGNVVLKLSEGLAKFFVGKLTEVFSENAITKASYLGVKSGLKKMKKSLDANEYGGAPLLGLSKPVIKAHGSSDAYAFRNAIRQAIHCVENGVSYKIAKLVVPEIINKDE